MKSCSSLLAVFAVLTAIAAIVYPIVVRVTSWSMPFAPVLKFDVEHVAGYFLHDTLPTGPESGFRAYSLPSLGLLEKAYPTDADIDPKRMSTQWERFASFVRRSDENSKGWKYKVLFLQRHGEGVHNVKEAAVGRKAWTEHWAREDGDETLAWADARLTPRGEAEAQAMRRFWEHTIVHDGVPRPERYFSSPLIRCIQTANAVLQKVSTETNPLPHLQISEALREVHGIHTCDRHRGRRAILSEFPSVELDDAILEEDTTWQADERETPQAATTRLREWIEDMFRDSNATFISATTHAGAIRALYRAVGHPDVWPGRGSITPLLVRAKPHEDET